MADSSGNGAHTGGEGASSRAGGGAAAAGGGVEDARRAGQRPSSDGAVNALGLPDGIPILILICVGVYIYLYIYTHTRSVINLHINAKMYTDIHIYIRIYIQPRPGSVCESVDVDGVAERALGWCLYLVGRDFRLA